MGRSAAILVPFLEKRLPRPFPRANAYLCGNGKRNEVAEYDLLHFASLKIRIRWSNKSFWTTGDWLTVILSCCPGIVLAEFRATFSIQTNRLLEGHSNENHSISGIFVFSEMSLIRTK